MPDAWGGRGGGYSGFQVMGMIKGFFGIGKVGKYFLGGVLIKVGIFFRYRGYSKQSKACLFVCLLYHLTLSEHF